MKCCWKTLTNHLHTGKALSSRGAVLECDQLRQTGRRRTVHMGQSVTKRAFLPDGLEDKGQGRESRGNGGRRWRRRRAVGTGGTGGPRRGAGGAGVAGPRRQQCGQGASRLWWSSACASAHPSANRQTGVSPAGYITHHCSAVSAALYSAKHRMARPPGYATGARASRLSSWPSEHCAGAH